MRFGGKPAQERLRAGLSQLPTLTWQYLITVRVIREPGKTQWEVEGATEIDLTTAKAFHSRGVVFINVTDVDVWEQEHIPGSVNLPVSRNPRNPSKSRLNKALLREFVDETEEFVIVGPTQPDFAWEQVAAAKAVRWGFQHVYYFSGGTSAWKEAGYSVEKGS